MLITFIISLMNLPLPPPPKKQVKKAVFILAQFVGTIHHGRENMATQT